MTVMQRVAICFVSGVVGALAVLVLSHIMFAVGLSQKLGVMAAFSVQSPEVYKPLFWGGLWGIPFGLLLPAFWNHLYLFGFLYVIAPLAALFLFFLPMAGAGAFGLKQGPMFTLYLVLVNLPFGIVTAWVARTIIGDKP